MTERQQIPWKRLTVEAVAIVGSILLAFAIDAWWADRLERKMETDTLERLHAEFSSNHQRLVAREEQCLGPCLAASSSDRIYELIDHALSEGATVIQIPDRLLLGLIGTPTFEPELPVLDSLRGSGGLAAIEAPQVLAAIAGWDRHIANGTDQEIGTRQFVGTTLIPALQVRGNIGHLFREFGREIAGQNAQLDGSIDITIDNELKTVVAQRYSDSTRTNRSMKAARDSAAQVLAEIEKTHEE